MSKLQKIAVVFLLIAVITGILHKTGVFYVPGLTALTLCVAMCAEGSDMLKGTGKKEEYLPAGGCHSGAGLWPAKPGGGRI